MTRDRYDESALSPPERRLVAQIAEHYRPRPMTAARQVAFGRALDRRLAQAAGAGRGATYAAALVATAALVLWLAGPVRPPGGATPSAAPPRPALHALVDPDAYEAEAEELLPEEYRLLARVLDVPVEDL